MEILATGRATSDPLCLSIILRKKVFPMRIERATTEKMKRHALLIRKIVFVEEQQIPLERELDEFDDEAIHLLAYLDEEPVGTIRLRPYEEERVKIERLAVLEEARSQRIGHALIDAAESEAKTLGAKEVVLNAQVQAIPFYETLGYQMISAPFIDAGIVHRTMTKAIQ